MKILNLSFSQESFLLLQELADKNGRTISDVLRIGLLSYSLTDGNENPINVQSE